MEHAGRGKSVIDFLGCVIAWLTVAVFMVGGVCFSAGVMLGDLWLVGFGVACVVFGWVLWWLDDMDV